MLLQTVSCVIFVITSRASSRAYMCMRSGAVAYFEKPEHYFDDDKDSLGEFSVMSIAFIESSTDPTCAPGCALDIHAYVTRGGDANGIRIFTLNASSPELCRNWMDELCAANGKFVIKENPETNHLSSESSSDLLKRRDDAKRKGSIVYAKEATINKVHATGSSAATEEAAAQAMEATISEEEAHARLLALEKRNAATVVRRPSNTSALNAGRGGAGVPRTITPGTIQRDSDSDLESHAQSALHISETAEEPQQGHHVQVQMRKPNILASGRGGAGRGGRGGAQTRPPTSGEM